MSSATPSPLSERDWRAYVLDMVEFCDKVQAYTAGFDLAGLLLEPMRFDAVARNLELLGEAATHVPADVRARWPDIPWRQIVATRWPMATSRSSPRRFGASSLAICRLCALDSWRLRRKDRRRWPAGEAQRPQSPIRFWNTSPACSRSAWNLILGQLLSMARNSGAYSTSSVGACTAS